MFRSPSERTAAATTVPGAGHNVIWFVILAAALIARLAFVAFMPPVIMWSDGREYETVARLLLDHGTYGGQALRPPGYPTLIAAVYRVFGENLIALRLVEVVLGTLSIGIVGLIGTRLFGRRAGLIAAALAALHPVLAFLPATEFPENFAVLLIVLALGATFAGLQAGGSWRWAAASGVLFGLATLVRANIITLLPGFGLGAAFLLARERRGWALPIVVCGAALALTLAPWIVRNHRVHGRWAFVSTGGGRQFWIGNSPRTTGSTLLPPEPDSTMREAFHHQNEFEMDAYYYRRGMEFIRANPGRAAQLYVLKLANLFALYPEPATRSFINHWSRFAQGISSVLVYLGALLALRRWKREPALWPMVAGIVGFSLVNALFFMNLRYRMAFEPCLLIMAGLGYAGLARGGASAGATMTPETVRPC